MINCPCCSDQLLRHIRAQDVYWFCPSCRQEMPVLEMKSSQVYQQFVGTSLIARFTWFENKEAPDWVPRVLIRQ